MIKQTNKKLLFVILVIIFILLVLRGWANWYTPPTLFSSLTETTKFWAVLEPSGLICVNKFHEDGTLSSSECDHYFIRLQYIHERLPTEETLGKWWKTATIEQKSEYNFRKGLAYITIDELDKELSNN